MNLKTGTVALVISLVCLTQSTGWCWDYEGHRMVNQLALASLPTNFPAFVLTPEARERIAFLSGEPDRWRNTTDLTLKHFNGPDHYFDVEDLTTLGMDVHQLAPFRYEFTAQLAANRAKAAGSFAAIDSSKNLDHTRELTGFLPWTITEFYAKLKSSFSYLKTFEETGTPEEVANARQNVLYIMGVMGHFVGDGAQPLHMTIHYNGWLGENPHHYSTNKTIHLWIDGGYLEYAGITTARLQSKVQPAAVLMQETRAHPTNLFPVVLNYLLDQYKLVEPLYTLERDGKLSGRKPVTDEGYQFITGQLLKSGHMLGSIWLTAWQNSIPDTYLRNELAKRRFAKEKSLSAPAEEKKKEDK
jgi:hypothetical protein